MIPAVSPSLFSSLPSGPESTYEGRAWDYKLLRQHCPFFGLIYPMGEGDEGYVFGEGGREGGGERGRRVAMCYLELEGPPRTEALKTEVEERAEAHLGNYVWREVA